MHIAEGILSPPVLVAGAALTVVGVGIGLHRLEADDVPKAGVLAAAFFVGSLIHVPIGPFSAHLILNGLLGIVLGWAAFPAILVGLTLQALFFGAGGLTVLGVNTFTMAAPAVACHYFFRRWTHAAPGPRAFAAGATSGALAIALASVLTAGVFVATGGDFAAVAVAVLVAHVPILLVEGLVTGAAVDFLQRVRPEVLAITPRPGPSRA